MIDVNKTLISQYANSETIYQIIHDMNEWIDPRNDINSFYDMVWNIDTAQGFGLDAWGRIVDIGRSIKIPKIEDSFGFKVSGNRQIYFPFNQRPFRGNENKFTYYNLSDDAYKTLIMIKAMVNIIYATAPSINSLLGKLFKGRGRCYFLTLGDMHARYVFEFYLRDYERSLIFENNFLPHPSGVDLDFREIIPTQAFGFNEAKSYQPFNQGTFHA